MRRPGLLLGSRLQPIGFPVRVVEALQTIVRHRSLLLSTTGAVRTVLGFPPPPLPAHKKGHHLAAVAADLARRSHSRFVGDEGTPTVAASGLREGATSNPPARHVVEACPPSSTREARNRLPCISRPANRP